MLIRKNKISRGLTKLLSSKKHDHFRNYPEIFEDNPANRMQYFEMFKKAQIVEIANSTI